MLPNARSASALARPYVAGALLLFTALSGGALLAAAAPPASPDYVPGEVIVQFEPGVTAAQTGVILSK
jgi:hypothetical protein